MATPLAEAFVRIRPQVDTFEKEAKDGLTKAGKGIQQEGKKQGRLFGLTFARATSGPFRSTAGVLTKSLGGIAAGFGAIKAIQFGKDAIAAASDLNESLSKTQVVFGKSSASVEAFAKTAAVNLGQSQQQALEATSTFGNLFTAMKIGQRPAADMSKKIVGLASDLASFNNVRPEEALEALRSGLVGETEPLRKFGVNLNEASIQAEALRLGLLKNVKDSGKINVARQREALAQTNLNKALKEHGRDSEEAKRAALQLDVAQQNLSKAVKGNIPPLTAAQKAQASYSLIMQQTTTAQGDFARTSDGLANKQRILSARWKDTQAALGKALLPVMIAVTSLIADKLVPGLVSLAKWAGRNKQLLLALGIGIATVLVPAFVAWAISAGAAAVATIAALAPVIAVGAAIAALAFLVIKNWGTIRKATVATWNFIKNVFRTVFLFIANLFLDVVATLIGGVAKLVGVFAKLPGPLGKPFKKAKEAIESAEQSVRDLQERINRTHGKKVVVSVEMQMKNKVRLAAQRGETLTITGKPIALATGGMVRGKGGIDKVPANLTAGEFVVKKSSVDKLGVGFLSTLNDVGGDPGGMTAKVGSGPLRFATGGLVSKARSLVAAQRSDPYVWGGVGPNGFDCSGLVGLAYAYLMGLPLFNRYFTTASAFRQLGWRRGTGAFTMGVNPGVHMAGNVGGLPFEAASTRLGIRVGGRATPVTSFPQQWYLASLGGKLGSLGTVTLSGADLRKIMQQVGINWGIQRGMTMASFDRGGWLQPGWTLAHNGTGRAERVGGSYHITFNVPPNANQHEIGRLTVESIKAFERGSGSGWRKP